MKRRFLPRFALLPALALALGVPMVGAAAGAGPDRPVSWFQDVNPLFKRSCNGCHNPNKLKGEVDTSTFSGLLKPGKHGANFVVGDPAKSLLVSEISGKEPSMPKEGDPLNPTEIALVTRWIQEGAKDDTPSDAYSTHLKEPPLYGAPPVITSLAVSPDGTQLAVSGYHEVFLLDAAESTLRARLVGESPRIESLAFSPDGTRLAVAGGAPARFGELQVWDTTTHAELKSFRQGSDSVFGVSWSPDGKRLAFGGVDKSVRVIEAADGHERMRFDNHSDWVLRTAWLNDGNRLLSGSRDRAMKLINTANGQFVDDINKLLEPVVSMTRHPREEWAAYGGADGGVRIYRMQENQDRTAGNNDVNLVREFERQSGPVHAAAFSPDGALLAVSGSLGEVRVYQTQDGKRISTCGGHTGAVFALAFSKDGRQMLTAGFEGLVRVFNPKTGSLDGIFNPVPMDAFRRPAVTSR